MVQPNAQSFLNERFKHTPHSQDRLAPTAQMTYPLPQLTHTLLIRAHEIRQRAYLIHQYQREVSTERVAVHTYDHQRKKLFRVGWGPCQREAVENTSLV